MDKIWWNEQWMELSDRSAVRHPRRTPSTYRPRLRVKTRVSEPGHYRQQLYQRTGLLAEENQARRLLNDLASYRAHLERKTHGPMSEVVAANRWLSEVYEPVAARIPADLRDKLDPVEVFHQMLEARLVPAARKPSHDSRTEAAAASYFDYVLPHVPDDLTSGRARPDANRSPA